MSARRAAFPTRRQVRSFAREGATLKAYEQAQGESMSQGLRAAAADGVFTAVNGTLATSELWEACVC